MSDSRHDEPSGEPFDVAILGAGPVGVEAALRSVSDGYRTLLIGSVGEAVRSWGHVRMFTPWRMNTSERGRVLLAQQGRAPLPLDDCPTGAQLVEDYLKPVVAAIADRKSRLTHADQSVAVSIRRQGFPKTAGVGSKSRAAAPFVIRSQRVDHGGRDATLQWHAAVVLDCTGTADGQLREQLDRDGYDGLVPDPGLQDWSDPTLFPGLPGGFGSDELKRFAVLGGGASAATDLVALATTDKSLTLVTRSQRQPFAVLPDDPLPGRANLFAEAAGLVKGGRVEWFGGVTVDGVGLIADPGQPSTTGRSRPDGLVDRLARPFGRDEPESVLFTIDGPQRQQVIGVGPNGEPVVIGPTYATAFDYLIDDAGREPNTSLFRELQVHLCYATEGPMRLAAHLMSQDAAAGDGPVDCLTQSGSDADLLATTEPGFFILGSKSYGRRSNFLLRAGLEQVDALFSRRREGRLVLPH